MVAHAGDTTGLDRLKGSETTPAFPYASRGAGLYSEVSWDPVAALRARAQRTGDKGVGPGPMPT